MRLYENSETIAKIFKSGHEKTEGAISRLLENVSLITFSISS